jgi:hypothetical protein
VSGGRQPSREAVERTAAALRQEAQKAGNGQITHEQAKARVVSAIEKKSR